MASTAPGPQSDVRQRTVLPQMLHGRQLNAAAGADDNLSSDEYLDKMEGELNRRVDDQIDVLRDGMAELVRPTDVSRSDGWVRRVHLRTATGPFNSALISPRECTLTG